LHYHIGRKDPNRKRDDNESKQRVSQNSVHCYRQFGFFNPSCVIVNVAGPGPWFMT
jgi:hypothetical protein